MLPPMPGQKAQKNAMLGSAEIKPFGQETQGGGIQPMQPMAQTQAMPMGKPDGGQLGVIRPMPELGAMQPGQGVQPPQMGQPAKPQSAGPMPDPNMAPRIRGPQTPEYTAAEIKAPEIRASGGSAGNFNIDQFRPFADSVYSEATRQLDPMFQQREEDFRQRMVNQGIGEGSDAYNKAFANFSRERNDAYGSARNQALSQALGAQNQMFGQSATNAQMAN